MSSLGSVLKLPLSAAIITKNEERNLPDCLKSLSFADEIVVVDSGSTDRTVEIAEVFGCRVFTEEWKGFGPQKNSAIEKCRYDWVLVLDADERIPSETASDIETILKKPSAAAYCFRRKNYLDGRWQRHAGYWPDWSVRLINRKMGRFEGMVHERWVTDGPRETRDASIDHYIFAGYSDMLITLNQYSTAIAEDLFASGKRAHAFSPLYHGLGMFFKIYLLEKGFLDGMDGLVTAVTKAGGSFFKYAKLLELQRGHQRQSQVR